MAYQVQANQFSDRVLDSLEAAYIAGLFDGEGSLYLVARKGKGRRSHHFHPEMTLANTYLPLLQRLVELTGNGAIYLTHQPGENHKEAHRWQLQPTQMHALLPQIAPYLFVKRRQAELMLEFFDLQRQADRGPWGYAKPEVIERILVIYAEIRILNRRGLVEVERLDFTIRDAKERKRTCDSEGCEDRRYRGHDVCYKHWVATQEPIQKVCEECSAPFEAVMQKARFCTPRCQWRNAARRRAEVS